MKKINLSDLHDNVFDTIGKEWMLITSGTLDHHNTMTASWGCLGWLWGKPVAVVFIRPERYTHEFVETNAVLTLSFLGQEPSARKAYNFAGSKSGRDVSEKSLAAGLTPLAVDHDSVGFAEARLTLVGRKLYKGDIKPERFLDPSIAQWYGGQRGGYHDVYIVELLDAFVDE